MAVTGTNGKTSVAHFTQQIWNQLGKKAASIGTLGVSGANMQKPSNLTTPGPVELHRLLQELSFNGVKSPSAQASSHGLDQCRLDGVNIQAGVFTNFSRDHLDYHQTEDNYLNSKLRLFKELICEDGFAIVYSGTPEAAIINSIAKQRKLNFVSYGAASSDISITKHSLTREGWFLTIKAFGRTYTALLKIAGEFQINNVLAALALVHSTGTPLKDIIVKIEALTEVPGRMQHAGNSLDGGAVYVDYAHTPDALKNALTSLKRYVQNKLILVFGCGGNRDPENVEMGAIACQFADRVIITDDNPRTEDASAIRSSIIKECVNACEIGDRRIAIEKAIAELEAGDVLLIAGKGHEKGQIIGNEVFPFDDVCIAKAALGEHK